MLVNTARHRWFSHLWGLVFVVLLSAGCGARQKGPLVVESDVQYPAWVLGGTGVHASGGQRVLIGVGQIDGMRNVALARATADNRARAELARVLEAFFAALLANVEAGDRRGEDTTSIPEAGRSDRLPPPSTPSVGDAHTNRAHGSHERDAAIVKSLLAASLPSVVVADHWFHPDRGAVFSEARLDVEEIRDGVARLRDVPEAMVSLLLSRLEPVHEAMLTAREAAKSRPVPAASAPAESSPPVAPAPTPSLPPLPAAVPPPTTAP